MQMYLVLSFLFFICIAADAQLSQDPLFDDYFKATTVSKRTKAAKQLLTSKYSFQQVYDRLAQGRTYRNEVRRGFFRLKQEGDHLPPEALVFVPYDYDATKKYQLMVYLHGAVSNLDPDFIYRHFVDTLAEAYRKSQTIYIYPSAWLWAPWWSKKQYDNIQRLTDQVKQQYNVDENLVRLGGVSDGGSGSYYLANCNITPWSSITPFIGSLDIVNYLNVRSTFISNFQYLPSFVVNGARDELYPKAAVMPYLQLLKLASNHSSQIIVDSAGHNMNWFPLLRDSLTRFVQQNRRVPFPGRVSWSTDSDKEYNRCYYLLINRLGNKKPAEMKDDFNEVELNGQKKRAHARDSVYGHIEAIVTGNTVKVKTDNIRKFTLLVSPAQFDLSQPVTVWINDVRYFNDTVKADLSTLLKWNAIDQDRTQLFAAELSFTVR